MKGFRSEMAISYLKPWAHVSNFWFFNEFEWFFQNGHVLSFSCVPAWSRDVAAWWLLAVLAVCFGSFAVCPLHFPCRMSSPQKSGSCDQFGLLSSRMLTFQAVCDFILLLQPFGFQQTADHATPYADCWRDWEEGVQAVLHYFFLKHGFTLAICTGPRWNTWRPLKGSDLELSCPAKSASLCQELIPLHGLALRIFNTPACLRLKTPRQKVWVWIQTQARDLHTTQWLPSRSKSTTKNWGSTWTRSGTWKKNTLPQWRTGRQRQCPWLLQDQRHLQYRLHPSSLGLPRVPLPRSSPQWSPGLKCGKHILGIFGAHVFSVLMSPSWGQSLQRQKLQTCMARWVRPVNTHQRRGQIGWENCPLHVPRKRTWTMVISEDVEYYSWLQATHRLG